MGGHALYGWVHAVAGAVRRMAAGGAPPFVADSMISVYNLIRKGAVAEVHPDLPALLGRPATDARAVLGRDFGHD